MERRLVCASLSSTVWSNVTWSCAGNAARAQSAVLTSNTSTSFHTITALLSLVQPGRFQEQVCPVVECVVFHIVAVRLVKGITGGVHPVELISDQALHVGTDGLALLR